MNPANSTQDFWDRIRISGPFDCREYLGYRNTDHYGIMSFQGIDWKAHRLAYTLAKGPIPEGMLVRHTCDNPPCCNPVHLLLGTHFDNASDRVTRGRSKPRRGTQHGRCKLTDAQVLEVLQKYNARENTQQMLATEYGVSSRTIWRILNGKNRVVNVNNS